MAVTKMEDAVMAQVVTAMSHLRIALASAEAVLEMARLHPELDDTDLMHQVVKHIERLVSVLDMARESTPVLDLYRRWIDRQGLIPVSKAGIPRLSVMPGGVPWKYLPGTQCFLGLTGVVELPEIAGVQRLQVYVNSGDALDNERGTIALDPVDFTGDKLYAMLVAVRSALTVFDGHTRRHYVVESSAVSEDGKTLLVEVGEIPSPPSDFPADVENWDAPATDGSPEVE